jgi:hypothetical protein
MERGLDIFCWGLVPLVSLKLGLAKLGLDKATQAWPLIRNIGTASESISWVWIDFFLI